jgi:hypothetical protein
MLGEVTRQSGCDGTDSPRSGSTSHAHCVDRQPSRPPDLRSVGHACLRRCVRGNRGAARHRRGPMQLSRLPRRGVAPKGRATKRRSTRAPRTLSASVAWRNCSASTGRPKSFARSRPSGPRYRTRQRPFARFLMLATCTSGLRLAAQASRRRCGNSMVGSSETGKDSILSAARRSGAVTRYCAFRCGQNSGPPGSVRNVLRVAAGHQWPVTGMQPSVH